MRSSKSIIQLCQPALFALLVLLLSLSAILIGNSVAEAQKPCTELFKEIVEQPKPTDTPPIFDVDTATVADIENALEKNGEVRLRDKDGNEVALKRREEGKDKKRRICQADNPCLDKENMKLREGCEEDPLLSFLLTALHAFLTGGFCTEIQ